MVPRTLARLVEFEGANPLDVGREENVGEVEREEDHFHALANGAWGEADGAVVAVSAAPSRLPVVGLRGSDVAEAWAAAHYVHHHAGQLHAGHV